MDLRDAEVLANQLIFKHIPDWQFKFNNKINTLGICSYQDRTIYLSRFNTEKQPKNIVEDTILHEIAHALTPGDGHGFKFTEMCSKLGCSTSALFHEEDYDRSDVEERLRASRTKTISNDISQEQKPEKYFCAACLEERIILKHIGKMVRLDCKHLVIYTPPPVIETPQSIIESVDFGFENLKTGDKPKPFQVEGIKFIQQSGFKCLIADEMGLGKTIQALGGIKKFQEHFCPCLIIVKSALKIQWFVQIINWLGIDFIPQIIEDGKNPPVEGFNIYIASYDIFRRFSTKTKKKTKTVWGNEVEAEVKESPFYDFPFKGIILDEVQSIKGESTRTEEVKNICNNKETIIALSGTPIKNNAAEYFTILNILRPDLFPSKKHYLRHWVESEVKKGFTVYKGIRHPEDFREYTKDFIIRRTRDEVMPELPKINRIFYHVDFENARLKSAYQAAENEFLRIMETRARKDTMEILAAISVARHLVGINKIIPIKDKAIEFLENTDRKVIIGLHHDDVQKTVFNLIKQYCQENNRPEPLHYSSALDSNARDSLISKFVNQPEIKILVGSTLAMGEGVDRLQHVCRDLIFGERQWNPANEEQFEGRLVRYGQKENVDGNYMVVTGTIDEYFTELVENKRRYMKQTLEGKDIGWSEAGLLQELYEAIAAKGRKKTVRGF